MLLYYLQKDPNSQPLKYVRVVDKKSSCIGKLKTEKLNLRFLCKSDLDTESCTKPRDSKSENDLLEEFVLIGEFSVQNYCGLWILF